MAVASLKVESPQLRIVDGRLEIAAFALEGAIVELAEEMGVVGRPAELARLLGQVVETGALVVLHGQRRAAVDAVAGEVERLLAGTRAEAEQLPALVQEQLSEHLARLAALLDARFDGDRTSSVQQQLRELVRGASSGQVRTLLTELLDEGGPLAASNREVTEQLRLVVGHNTDVLAKVTSLIEKLEQRRLLDEQQERSIHKGAPFEDTVELELNAIFGRLGDRVRCVKHETGVVPGSQAGDFLVTVNVSQADGGREARVVVEAKSGRLSGPKAHQELQAAIANRGAQAGIIVFDGVEDAPLRGRHYMAYPDGEIVAVLDPEHGTLAFEVACIQARLHALNAVAAGGAADAKWLLGQCEKLSKLIEQASAIMQGTAAARRGLDKIDASYDQLRQQTHALLEEITARLT